MKRIPLVILLALLPICLWAQEITITFSGAGDSAIVDSIIATNLTTYESVVVPGSESLILTAATGLYNISLNENLSLYPNPFQGRASLVINQIQEGKSVLTVNSLAGQEIINKAFYLNRGLHRFELTIKESGIYLIKVSGVENLMSKVICLNSAEANSLSYFGFKESFKNDKVIQQSQYELGYSQGDWIHYEGYSNKYITIITDSVVESRRIDFEFVDCTDSDGNSYKVVKIGDQFWMGENLAYVPNINPATWSSKSSPYVYVNGYEDTIVSAAISMPNYVIYGALYNYTSAASYCPEGWHLPSREEWLSLIEYLGESPVFKLKETGSTHWVENQKATNTSGFSALPGGFKKGYWEGPWSTTYISPGFEAIFWTATAEDSDSINETTAWNISLSAYNNDYEMRLYDKCGHTTHSYPCTTLNNGYSVRCVKDEYTNDVNLL